MTIEATGATTTVARKQVSRRKLLDAARELFVERGYHDTRPQDIARAAGVGHGTFYLHFADKRECFLAFVDEAANELNEYTREHTRGVEDFGDFVRGTIRGCIAYSEDHPGIMRAAMVDASVIGGDTKELADAQLPNRWAKDWVVRLEKMMKVGSMRQDLDPRIIAAAIVGACSNAFAAGERQDIAVETVIENLVGFLARAIEPR
jgi:AcrR family transcriptional regulator